VGGGEERGRGEKCCGSGPDYTHDRTGRLVEEMKNDLTGAARQSTYAYSHCASLMPKGTHAAWKRHERLYDVCFCIFNWYSSHELYVEDEMILRAKMREEVEGKHKMGMNIGLLEKVEMSVVKSVFPFFLYLSVKWR
jgi:hypothetical protein